MLVPVLGRSGPVMSPLTIVCDVAMLVPVLLMPTRPSVLAPILVRPVPMMSPFAISCDVAMMAPVLVWPIVASTSASIVRQCALLAPLPTSVSVLFDPWPVLPTEQLLSDEVGSQPAQGQVQYPGPQYTQNGPYARPFMSLPRSTL